MDFYSQPQRSYFHPQLRRRAKSSMSSWLSEGATSLQFKFQPNSSRGSTTTADDVKDRQAYRRLEFRRQTLIIFGRQKSNLRILWGSLQQRRRALVNFERQTNNLNDLRDC